MSFLMEHLTQDFEMYSLHKMHLKCMNTTTKMVIHSVYIVISGSITAEKNLDASNKFIMG